MLVGSGKASQKSCHYNSATDQLVAVMPDWFHDQPG